MSRTSSRLFAAFAATTLVLAACTPAAQPTPTPAPAAKPPEAAKPAAAAKPTEAPAKPAAAPAAKPAGSPVTKPAGAETKPAASPAAKPAASPATKPAEAKPAASPAAAAKPAAAPAAARPLGTPAAGLQRIGGTVSVLGTWGGDEQEAFLAMVRPFEEQTGIRVEYEGTRDLNAILTTRVQGGNPPDLAGLPGPGQMAEFARANQLVNLGPILDQSAMRQMYAEDWLRLGQVDGNQVGIFIKAALKGPIWYNPKTFQQVSGGTFPQTWNELLALSERIAATGTAPWCIGLESGAASGWPGTDWIEDIVLRQAGPQKYDQWYQGQLAWTSPEIRSAWQEWGKIVANERMVFGGRQYMLTTNFGDAGQPLFTSPPRCYMHHQGSFITEFFTKANTNLKPVEDFNFFPFPDINPEFAGAQEVAGDLFGVFRDTPQSRALIQYLVTPEAQAIWVRRGGALSPNRMIPLDVYPTPIARQQAEALVSAPIVRFDASDLMPEAMNNAFWKGILDYVQNPGNLDSILTTLDRVQQESYRQ